MQAVTQAIAGLSERKVQFTYTDVGRTVGMPPENGVIERARAGIDEAIGREQLIPLTVRGAVHIRNSCAR
ncbi:Multifunctional conjugation protein TraI [Escherichia coli]|nr:Multifunctional conjugation protein TraI [Escherichia coli]